MTQWLEALERDVSQPAIIGWYPLNETHQVITDQITVLDDVTHALYLATKLADPTRPVLDASGYSHRVRGADVYDSHNYEQEPGAFRTQMGDVAGRRPASSFSPGRHQPHEPQQLEGLFDVLLQNPSRCSATATAG